MVVSVLVADRSPFLRRLIRDALAPGGHEVMTASSCALALFLANKSLPDLVIAGEELTDGSFADLLSELKGDPELAPIPFVVVTKRQAYPGMRRQAIELGASDLIEGPLNSRAVVDVIGKFLVAHDMTREPQTPE